jgi:15-cis-phytoene synthase
MAPRMSGRDTNFYYSFLVLPAEKRRAIVAVWDFCRAADDAVDEPVSWGPGSAGGPAAELARWRAEVAACFDGGRPETGQGRRLLPFVKRFGLPRDAFEQVLDGIAMDLDHTRYPTFDDLREYCCRVASAVGLICLEIFGYRDPVTRQYAVDLGIALQLTNIIRDVQTDLRRGRIYLPADDLWRFEVEESHLAAGVVTPHITDLLAFQCRRARMYYEKAESELPRCDRRSLLAARIMGAIYRGVLERIEASGYDVFSQKIRVPRPRRAVIALSLWGQSLLGW